MENKNMCDCTCLHASHVNEARDEIDKVKIFKNMSEFFKTFADITRLKIICALDRVGSMCVCDIAVTLNMTKSAISHQLKFLKDNKLIVATKKGKETFYSLADKHVQDIFEMGLNHLEELDAWKRNIISKD